MRRDYRKISSREILLLLKNVGLPDNVIEHCKTVCKKALLLSKGKNVDIRLVKAAALLHDIGRARTHGIEHGVAGAEMLRELGFSEKLVRTVERHVGSGIQKKEALALGLPPKSYLPRTLEEKIVCHADNLVSGTRIISFEEALDSYKKKFGADSEVVRRLKRLHEELK